MWRICVVEKKNIFKEMQKKLMVQTSETLSLIEDIEQLKRANKRLLKTMLDIKRLVDERTGDVKLVEDIGLIIDEVVK